MTIDRNNPPAAGGSPRAMDIINALLAVWLFISPWVLIYGAADAWNTWVASVIIFLAALSALSRPTARLEYVTLVLGAWMFISPWVFTGTNPSMGASWNQWLVGAAVFLISAGAIAARRNMGLGGMTHAHSAH